MERDAVSNELEDVPNGTYLTGGRCILSKKGVIEVGEGTPVLVVNEHLPAHVEAEREELVLSGQTTVTIPFGLIGAAHRRLVS